MSPNKTKAIYRAQYSDTIQIPIWLSRFYGVCTHTHTHKLACLLAHSFAHSLGNRNGLTLRLNVKQSQYILDRLNCSMLGLVVFTSSSLLSYHIRNWKCLSCITRWQWCARLRRLLTLLPMLPLPPPPLLLLLLLLRLLLSYILSVHFRLYFPFYGWIDICMMYDGTKWYCCYCYCCCCSVSDCMCHAITL